MLMLAAALPVELVVRLQVATGGDNVDDLLQI